MIWLLPPTDVRLSTRAPDEPSASVESFGDELGLMSVMLAIVNGGGVGAGAAWWLISAGIAFTSPDVFDAAKITTFPVPAWSIPASDAVVSIFSMSVATDGRIAWLRMRA